MTDIPFYGFMNPSRLWILLVVPVLIALYIVIVRRKSKQGMRYTDTTILRQVLPKQSQWLRHVVVALSVLSLISLALAWARPEGVDRVARERATVVLVVDVSWSMTATDVAPTRLDAAKEAAKEFIDELPDGFNVALVTLSGNPQQVLPPQNDHDAAKRAIDTFTPQDSSAVGDALVVALSAIDQAPPSDDGTVAPAMIALLSDGGNTNGQAPLQIANQAKDKGVPVYTIAFGTDNGYVDLDGERFTVAPDLETMSRIAEITGAEAYTADNVSQLNDAYDSIGSSLGYELTRKEITATAAFVSLIFALFAAIGAVMLGVRFK